MEKTSPVISVGPGPGSIEVPLHRRPHLSDLVAEYLIRHYGKEKYGEDARIGGPRVVHVGRGGYDEHNPENLPDPDVPECEATLVARDLGIRYLPELSLVLDYTLDVDRRGQRKGFLKFGRLAELLHDVLDEEGRVKHWTFLVIEAAITASRAVVEGREKPPVSRRVIRSFLRRAYTKVRQEFVRQPFARAARKHLQEYLRGWLEEEFEFEPFGLPHCLALLWRYRFGGHRWGERWMIAWITDGYRAELVRQQKFYQGLVEADGKIEDDALVKEALFQVHGDEVVALLIHSDSSTIHSAVFSEEFSASGEFSLFHIAAVRRSSGNVQIFRRLHGSRKAKIWMQYVVALIRERERAKRGYDGPLAWAELTAASGPPGAENWFFYEPTHGIFNGSLTEPAEPTLLTDEEILECITRGLDDEYAEFRDEFRRARLAA